MEIGQATTYTEIKDLLLYYSPYMIFAFIVVFILHLIGIWLIHRVVEQIGEILFSGDWMMDMEEMDLSDDDDMNVNQIPQVYMAPLPFQPPPMFPPVHPPNFGNMAHAGAFAGYFQHGYHPPIIEHRVHAGGDSPLEFDLVPFLPYDRFGNVHVFDDGSDDESDGSEDEIDDEMFDDIQVDDFEYDEHYQGMAQNLPDLLIDLPEEVFYDPPPSVELNVGQVNIPPMVDGSNEIIEHPVSDDLDHDQENPNGEFYDAVDLPFDNRSIETYIDLARRYGTVYLVNGCVIGPYATSTETESSDINVSGANQNESPIDNPLGSLNEIDHQQPHGSNDTTGKIQESGLLANMACDGVLNKLDLVVVDGKNSGCVQNSKVIELEEDNDNLAEILPIEEEN